MQRTHDITSYLNKLSFVSGAVFRFSHNNTYETVDLHCRFKNAKREVKTTTFASLCLLTLFFPVFLFDPPESIKKTNVRFSDVFRGINRKLWEEKG